MRSSVILLLVVSIFIVRPTQVSAQTSAIQPFITILTVKQGRIEYSRQGWKTHQVLLAGTLIDAMGLVYPTNATILVMRPDGRTRESVSSELVANTPINCQASNS